MYDFGNVVPLHDLRVAFAEVTNRILRFIASGHGHLYPPQLNAGSGATQVSWMRVSTVHPVNYDTLYTIYVILNMITTDDVPSFHFAHSRTCMFKVEWTRDPRDPRGPLLSGRGDIRSIVSPISFNMTENLVSFG